MNKQQLEDYPELDGFIGDNEYGDANSVSVIQSKLAAEKLVSMQNEIERLKSELNRVSEFLKFHIERWDGIEPIDPSIQVLKRCLPEGLNK